jgi:5-methylcytosine-specific restriction endonuclease McrA
MEEWLTLFGAPAREVTAYYRCSDGVEQCLTCARAEDQRIYLAARAQVVDGEPTCAYCTERATTADHVLPRCQGGTHDLANLVPACGPCNTRKSGRTPEQWRSGAHPHQGKLARTAA